jgi:hypothetical protein
VLIEQWLWHHCWAYNKTTGSTFIRNVTAVLSLRSKTPSPPSLSVRSPSRALYHTLHDISRHLGSTLSVLSRSSNLPPFIMASYLRSLFSSGQPTPSHGKAKSRSRTHSTPAPSPYYVYTSVPGNTPSTSTTSGTSQSKVQRANSNKTPVMVSSPLRYPTYDSRHSHDDSRPSPNRAANHQPPPDTMNGPYSSHTLDPYQYICSSHFMVRGTYRTACALSAEWLRNSGQLTIKLKLFVVSWPSLWQHSLRAFSAGPESASFSDIIR